MILTVFTVGMGFLVDVLSSALDKYLLQNIRLIGRAFTSVHSGSVPQLI